MIRVADYRPAYANLGVALKESLEKAGVAIGPGESVHWDGESVRFAEGTVFYDAVGDEKTGKGRK